METVPQLDFSVYPSQIVWFVCAFVLLYLSVRCVVVPRVESEIGFRARVQGAMLDKAGSAYAHVRDELLRQKASLDDAEKRAQKLVGDAVSEVDAVREEALKLLDDEVGHMMSFAEQQLEVLRRDSRKELISLSGGVATVYYAKVSGSTASDMVKNKATKLSTELYGESYD